MDQPNQGQVVLAALDELAQRRRELLETGRRLFGSDGGRIYKTDLFTIGAIKRAVSLSAGFDVLVRARNLVCARALIRLQMDTVLRFSALDLVADADGFADAVLGDERVDKLKDRYGNRLTDAHLVEKLNATVPWVRDVYRRTSGYVHLSGQHIYSAVHAMNDSDRTMTMVVGEQDTKFPDETWLEMIACFISLDALFIDQVQRWLTNNGQVPKAQ